MKPVYWVIAFVAGAALASAWHWSADRGAETPPPKAAPAAVMPSVSAVGAGALETGPHSAAVAAPTDAEVTRWIAELRSPDAGTRATAIGALADAPRARALPALRHVLLNGEPLVDRPMALNSLRELALGQGDADGGIRQAIREVIYHGDDESLAAGAQDALDVVEESELK